MRSRLKYPFKYLQATGLLMACVLCFAACDSTTVTEESESSFIPPPDPQVAISVDINGRAEIRFRMNKKSGFRTLDVPNRVVEEVIGGDWNANGQEILFSAPHTTTSAPGEIGRYVVASDSIIIDPVSMNGLEGFPSPDKWSIFENPGQPHLVAFTQATFGIAGLRQRAGIADLTTGEGKTLQSNRTLAVAGWLNSEHVLILGMQDQRMLIADRNLVVLDTIEVDPGVFSNRMSPKWLFKRGDVNLEGTKVAVELISRDENNVTEHGAQIAILDMKTMAVTWVSESREWYDRFPTWGPDGDVYFISTAPGDRSMDYTVAKYFDASKGRVEHYLSAADIGANSILSIDLFWE
jgi:hypothetical protein